MISKEQFMGLAIVSIDQHFPKGKATERGQAMVMIAEMLRYLQEHGAVGDDRRYDPVSKVYVD